MTIVLYQIFLHTKIRVERLPDILFSCLLFHRKCRWTSTWIEFFLCSFLVSLLICSVNFWLCRWPATYQILGRCSTRIPSTLHRFCQSFRSFEKIWSILILVFLALRRACGAAERMGWSFFSFAALNLPTCHWLGCSRALKPRRSATSSALVDEPGRDSQKFLAFPWYLWTPCPRHSKKSFGAATTQQGADDSVPDTPWGARERQPSPRAPSAHPLSTCGRETHTRKGSVRPFWTPDLGRQTWWIHPSHPADFWLAPVALGQYPRLPASRVVDGLRRRPNRRGTISPFIMMRFCWCLW